MNTYQPLVMAMKRWQHQHFKMGYTVTDVTRIEVITLSIPQ